MGLPWSGNGIGMTVCDYSYFLNIRDALVPPKPNELLRAVFIEACLASCGT